MHSVQKETVMGQIANQMVLELYYKLKRKAKEAKLQRKSSSKWGKSK